MVNSGRVSVRFWGVRGSIACPGPETVRYGGNTSCVEIRCGDHLLIMDGGTGLRELGGTLLKNGPINADLFYTHTHFDHICGLPFFGPAYVRGNKIRLWAGHLLPEHCLEDVLFVIFPRDPSHGDSFMDRVGGDARKLRPSTIVAREGMVLIP